jgi:hypothetical protein
MTPYILTAYNSRNILAEGTLLDCWKWLMRHASDLTVVEAMAFYKIDKAPQTK